MIPVPDPKLAVTPASPGLHIYAPVDPNRPFAGLVARPRASYACRCGYTRHGVGHQEVADVVAAADAHKAAACSPATDTQAAA